MTSLHFAICAALLLSGAASPSRKENEIKRRMNDIRIVGGNLTYTENMPYMVSLHDSGIYLCGGSILNHCYVLTSAGCVAGKDPEALTIRGGSAYFNESGNEYAAGSIVTHPKFSEGSHDYNVALIKTRAPMVFCETVQSIPLADQEPKVSEPVTVAGWGELEEGGELQHQIHFAVVQMADKKKCAAIYENFFGFTDRMMCTYGQGKGACHGDNGGPAVHNNHLVGVISHRLGCGTLPDVHADVVNKDIREFITTNIHGECK